MSDDVISNNRARGREEREVTRTRKGKRRTKESNSDVSMTTDDVIIPCVCVESHIEVVEHQIGGALAAVFLTL